MKRLFFTTLILVFAGCMHPGSLRKLQPGNWREFDKGNRLQGLAWSGSGCESLHGSLHLSALAQGEGVCLSQKTAVLPGHYDFTVQLMLHSSELGVDHPLDDLVSIRLHVYDRWGRELDSNQLFLGKMIDAGEMNYGLNRIVDSKGLAQYSLLHLAPRYHPFDSLWLPKKAASVRVEVRLQGAAILHLKDFHLAYDKWNFPLCERVAKLGKKEKNLVPAPQEIKNESALWPLDPAKDALCIEPGAVHPAIERGLWQLEQKLSRLGFETPLPRGSCKNASWVLNIGSSQNLGHGKEAYSLQVNLSKSVSVILNGASPRATYYGIQTLIQLFEKDANGQTWFRPVEILDYPSFPLRSTSSYDRRARLYRQEVEAGRWLAETRLNAILLNIAAREPRWWIHEPVLLETAKRLGEESREAGLFDLGILFNPYQDRVNPKSKKVLRFSDDQTFQDMQRSLRPFLQQGVKQFFLTTDDLPPRQEGLRFSYLLEDEKDQQQLKTLSRAHARMITALDAYGKINFPAMQIYFVPPWYNNLFVELSEAKQGKPYLDELSRTISKNIPILWTGPTVRSLWIDALHLEKYSRWINGRKPMLWDNTLYARRLADFWGASAKRSTLCSYFEPYDVKLPENFAALNHPAGIFLNAELNEFYRIQLATAGAYYWNPKGYQPEQALWRYLKNRFGEKGAQLILDLDALLWELTAENNAGRSNRALHRKSLETLAQLEAEIQQTGGADLLDEFREVILRQAAWH